MKKYKKIRVFFIICGVLAAGAVLFVLYMPHRNIQHETPVIVSTSELVEAYQKDEASANSKFLDKAIQVTGTINEVETNSDGQTVVSLSGPTPLSGVRCTLKKKQAVETGKTLTLKGRCTGYLSDVVIVDCLIIE